VKDITPERFAAGKYTPLRPAVYRLEDGRFAVYGRLIAANGKHILNIYDTVLIDPAMIIEALAPMERNMLHEKHEADSGETVKADVRKHSEDLEQTAHHRHRALELALEHGRENEHHDETVERALRYYRFLAHAK